MASLKWGTSSQQQGVVNEAMFFLLEKNKELWSSLKETCFFVGKMVKYTVQGGIAFARLLLRSSKETWGGHILSLNNWSTYEGFSGPA